MSQGEKWRGKEQLGGGTQGTIYKVTQGLNTDHKSQSPPYSQEDSACYLELLKGDRLEEKVQRERERERERERGTRGENKEGKLWQVAR